jgi:outer membrane protein OmpA-like peptidoglycan-associated protein
MKIMNARYNWTEVCGTFVSTGGEKYIMLGNFLSDDETKYERMKKSKDVKVKEVIAAYYYIDDVSVQLLDSDKGERCECAAEEAGDSYSTTIYQKVFQMTEEMTVSDQIEEHQVFFAFGRDKMNSEGKESLDFIIEQLKANPEMKLQINAHNNAMEDEVGMENDFYADMDGKRLGSVIEYLIAGGIDEGILIATQKGSDSPNPDVTEEDLVEDEDLALAKSRRVTFKVR